MPDSNSPDQPKQPAPPVPSPPLPTIPPKPASSPSTPGASSPAAPVPSPPLPPIPPKTPAAPIPSPPVPSLAPKTPPAPAGFKLSGDLEPATPAATTAPATLTPEEQALLAPSQTPAAPRPAPAPPRHPQAPTGSTPGGAGAPAAPRTPSIPRAPGAPAASTPGAPARGVPVVPQPKLPGAAPHHAHPEPAAAQHANDEYTPPAFDIRDILNRLSPIAEWMFRIGLAGIGLSLAFLLYATFAGNIGKEGVPAAMVGNVKLAVSIFNMSAILLAISGIMLAFDMTALGIALIIGGVLLHFGAPWALFNHVGSTKATLALVNGLRATGMWLMVMGVLKFGMDLMQWIIHLPDRMKQGADVGVGRKAEAAQQRASRDANVFSPCWQLPYCRETIRKQCPAFLAKKTCWKFGRGCYCDEEMISRIIRGESLDVIKAPTRLSKTGKPPCGRCHIYLEHQGHKYKMLSPGAVPITALAMYLIWPIWTKLFMAFSNSPLWEKLSFDTKKLAPEGIATDSKTSGGLPPEQVMHVATILFGVLIGFFVLIYVCKFIEWFVYKAKL